MTKTELKNIEKLPIMAAKIQALNNIRHRLDKIHDKWYLINFSNYNMSNEGLRLYNKDSGKYFEVRELWREYCRIRKAKLI